MAQAVGYDEVLDWIDETLNWEDEFEDFTIDTREAKLKTFERDELVSRAGKIAVQKEKQPRSDAQRKAFQQLIQDHYGDDRVEAKLADKITEKWANQIKTFKVEMMPIAIRKASEKKITIPDEVRADFKAKVDRLVKSQVVDSWDTLQTVAPSRLKNLIRLETTTEDIKQFKATAQAVGLDAAQAELVNTIVGKNI